MYYMNVATYPRKVTLVHLKLKELLEKKQELILAGREVSVEIEDLEAEMDKVDKEIQELEKTVDLSDLKSKSDEITEKFNRVLEEMELVKTVTYERIKAKIPGDIITKYENLKTLKSEKEKERNKVALRAQKIKDKIIPLGQKLLKPSLTEEYDDCNGVELENGELVGTIFNHMDDFRKRYAEKQKIKYL